MFLTCFGSCIHLPLLFWLSYLSFFKSSFGCCIHLLICFCCIHLSISFGLVVLICLFVLIAGSTCQLVLVAVSIELVLVAVNICLFYFFGCCIQICLVPHTHQSIIFWLLCLSVWLVLVAVLVFYLSVPLSVCKGFLADVHVSICLFVWLLYLSVICFRFWIHQYF